MATDTVSTNHTQSEITTTASQGIEIASAEKFCDFKAREGSQAAIFHEIFEISNFAPDLGDQNSDTQELFRDAAAQPQQPAHIPQQTDGRISKTIVKIQSRKPKLHENAPKFCSPFVCFEAPAGKSITWTERQNRLHKSYAIINRHRDAARH